MFKMRFIKSIIILLVFVALLHIFALSNSLYILIPSLDTMIHAISGFITGMAAISIFERVFQKCSKPKKLKLFLSLVFTIIIVGVGWEIFEKQIGFTSYLDTQDTITDLIADIVGALSAYGMYRFIIW